MRHRIRQVFVTYLTRPMVRVLGAIYVVVFSIAIFDLNEPWRSFISGLTYPEVSYSGRTQRLVALDAALKDQNQRPLSSTVVTVTIDGPGLSASHLRQLQACPRLRMLKLNSLAPFDFHKKLEIGDEEAAALGELKQLEVLSLSGCNLTPNIWRHLGQLPNLRFLDLSGCGLWGDYAGLESLSRLETLILGTAGKGFQENQASLLPELKRIPNLKMLVVWDYYPLRTLQMVAQKAVHGTPAATPQPSDPVIDAFEDLKAIPSLQTLYVNEFGINFSGEFRGGPLRFEVFRRELTHLQMRPACVDSYRTSPVVGVMIQSVILMVLLVLQFHSHFHQVGAHLIPNYKTPHVVPLVVIWIAGVFANILPFMNHGVPLLAATGLGLLPWTILCGLGFVGIAVQAVTSTMHKLIRTLILLAVLGWAEGLLLILPWNRSTIDWYFRGHEPGSAWYFITTGIVTSAGLLWLSVNWASKCMASVVLAPPPPLGSSLTDNMAWVQLYWQQKKFEHQWKRMTNSINRKLERAIQGAAISGWRTRSNLWIVGNLGIFGPVGDSNSLTKGMLCFMAGVLILSAVVNHGVPSDLRPLVMLWNPMIAIDALTNGPSSYVIFAATFWRFRRKLFACESLRPISRRQFDREIATAIAWDLFPLGGVYLAVLTWSSLQADPEMWSVLWTLIMLIFFVAQWIVVYGFTLWSIVIRRDWIVIPAGFIAFLVLVGANSMILSRQSQMFGGVTTSPLMELGPLTCWNLLFAVVSCVIARSAYWRWQSVELE